MQVKCEKLSEAEVEKNTLNEKKKITKERKGRKGTRETR
jgi:hypothetical protein